MTRWATRVALAFVVLLALIQFARPARTNPPFDPAQTLHAQLPPNAAAADVVDRSCRDCHSHETVWPWYSQVAPVAWLVAHDVNDGRRAMNFSQWTGYAPDRQRKLLRDSCEAVSEGEMPMWSYLVLHRDARLAPADVTAICALSGSIAARNVIEPPDGG